jgi:hypothetical protein
MGILIVVKILRNAIHICAYPYLRSFSHKISCSQQIAALIVSMPDTAAFPMTAIALKPECIQRSGKLDIQPDHVESILQKVPRKDIAMMKIYRYHNGAVNVCRERKNWVAKLRASSLYFYLDVPSFPC